MELRVLRYFLAVAREESISAAAQSLHLTQPTLSRQLMELEAELGTQLFVRGNRKVTLTEEGMRLRRRASEILSLVEKTELEFRETEEQIRGKVYIGAGETCAMHLIARAARELSVCHPMIRYHLYSGNAQEVAERLDQGLLDFGVLIEPADLKKYDYLDLPTADTWGVLLRKDHPLAQKTCIQPKDLHNEPLILSRQSLVDESFFHWLGKEEADLNIAATYNLLYNASIWVEEGLGCAVCLDRLISIAPDSGLCFRPLEPKQQVRLHVVWKKYTVFSPAAEHFLDTLRGVLSSDAAPSQSE